MAEGILIQFRDRRKINLLFFKETSYEISFLAIWLWFGRRQKLIAESRDAVTFLSTLNSRVKAIEQTIKALKSNHSTLQTEVDVLKHTVTSLKVDVTENCISEFHNRMARSNNIIIQGILEKNDGSVEERSRFDESEVKGVMNKIGISGVEISNVHRIGKKRSDGSRLLKVRVNDPAKKVEILRKCKDLKKFESHKGIYINPDRTPMQQEKDKHLRDELKDRREKGEDVVIFRDRVVVRADIQNFRLRVL